MRRETKDEAAFLDALRFKGEQRDVGLVLLAALRVGTSIRALVEATGLPRATVSKVVWLARGNKIFVKGKIHGNWDDEQEGGLAFVMDAMVCEGLLRRTR